MWRITRKEIAAHKLRFVLLALAVILGVAFMSGTQVLTATINKSFDDLFADINRGTDAVVRAPEVLKSDFGPGGGTRPRIAASVADLVRRAPGVEAAEGNVQLDYAQIVDKNRKAIGNPGSGAPSLGFGWDPNPRINPFHVVPPGRPPAADDEVVIDKHTADDAKFHIGDRAEILTPKPPKTYRIVGIAKFGTADSLLGASAALFTLPEVQRIADAPNQFDQVSAVAATGVTQEQLKANIQSTLAQRPDLNLEVLTGKELTKENQDDVHKAIGFFSTALLIFALVALLVGMFIIYNTFSIIVAQRKREMALLRAIGASRTQVLGAVIGESVVVGLVASALGVAGGVLLAAGLKAVLAAFGLDIPASGIVLPTSAIVTGLAAGTLITIFSAVFPARQAARVPPIAAMRDVALERPPNRGLRLAMGGGLTILGIVVLFLGLGGSGIALVGLGALLVLIGVFVLGPLFARGFSRAIGAPIAAIKGMTGKLARENAARNPKRTATTASALMIGVALVGFITIFAASAKASVSAAIDNTLKTDYVVTGGQGSPTLSPALDREIAALPVIQASTPLRAGQAKIDGSTVQVEAADPTTASQLIDVKPLAGNFETLTANGLAVSKDKADSKHWAIGSQVDAQFVKTGKTPVLLTIQMIYKEKLLAGDYFMSLTSFENYFKDQLDFVIFAKLRPGITAEEGRAALEPVVAKYPNADLKDNAQYKADQEAQVTQIVNLVYALLFLAVFIALIGIVITLLLSIYERTRELGLLRAVGTSRSQVRSIVRWESVIISLLGTLVGLVVGVFFGWSVVQALKDEGFDKFAVAPVQLVVVVIIAAILGVVAAIWPARRASKLDVLLAIGQE
jgi:putative ABC transport system permease protein